MINKISRKCLILACSNYLYYMKHLDKSFFLLMLAFLFVLTGQAQEKPAIGWKDIDAWEFIRTNHSSLSPDGQWLTWTSGPTKGDLTLTIQHTGDTTLRYHFPIGATSTNALFSHDGNYIAFRESPTEKEAEAAKKAKKPAFTKLQVVSLIDTQKVTFERIRNFAFSGENPEWIGIALSPADGAPRGADAPSGTDFLLYHLQTKTTFNLGNVGEFAFNKAGNLLAYTIDAHGQNGNGILIRDLATGITTPVDNDKASYKRINWNEEGTAFALLKAKKHDDYKTPVHSVVGVSNIKGSKFSKVIYTGVEDTNFPDGMGITEHAAPYWSTDLSTLFFGVAGLEKKENKSKKNDNEERMDSVKTPAKGPGGSKADIAKPDVIIWNWQDKRLQSAQQVQRNRDQNASFVSAYHVGPGRFIQLADSVIRSVAVGPEQQYALGYDYTPYEVDNNLSGQTYVDIYLIDVRTGERSLLLENHYQNASRTMEFAPNGKFVAYYKDGVYYVVDLGTKAHRPLTDQIPYTFINTDNDHNITNPATPFFGWTVDSRHVLIRDNFDLWKISVDGRKVTALTDNWKKDGNRAFGFSRIYPDDKGIDFKKDQYLVVFNEDTKQRGYAILESGKDQLRILFMDDHAYGGLQKADRANFFVYTKESSHKSPELFMARDKELSGTQITHNTPQQEKYAWSEEVRLIEFVSAHGDTLQAALYLPANYEPGKSYPTITYIYERLTQGLNQYVHPAFPGGGFNRAMYTSNGYAVLMPDIKYQLNEPGNSAVACVVPAVEAAIATGIVDRHNVAIHGHSWGGYQTSFLITQTNIFKAAAAGAPLTNMISMYSLIYWNSGSANQSIFESSQGRLTTGYWDNWDAYKRNSPIYYIKNVETPLLLLHNDKDGAVDYTQGIEYFNGLRRLNKPVTMITYKGENHGIAKEENKKDYAVRMMEFMDHFLKGKPAPDWWEKGVDLLDLDKHLEERAF